jgi:hypothetical protein
VCSIHTIGRGELALHCFEKVKEGGKGGALGVEVNKVGNLLIKNTFMSDNYYIRERTESHRPRTA